MLRYCPKNWIRKEKLLEHKQKKEQLHLMIHPSPLMGQLLSIGYQTRLIFYTICRKLTTIPREIQNLQSIAEETHCSFILG